MVRRTTMATLAALLIVAATAAPQQALAASASASVATTAHGGKKGGKVALPVCASGSASTTYSCDRYGKNICEIATGTCKLATQAQLGAVAERTDCDFLASPSDKGGCGLATREELSEFESESFDVITALAQENLALMAAVDSLATAVSLIATQLPANVQVPPPSSTDPLCLRQLTYDGAVKHPPFTNTGYTVWNVIPINGGTISCSNAARDAFVSAVLTEAPKPDNCPLVPNMATGGQYDKVRLQNYACSDLDGKGLPTGKSLYFQLTLSWQTRFPCPSSPLARLTSDPSKAQNQLFSTTSDGGCDATKGCDPCRPAAVAGNPDGKAICDAIYSAFPANTVRVTSSWSWNSRQSFCSACVAANDVYCSPDGRNPYVVGI